MRERRMQLKSYIWERMLLELHPRSKNDCAASHLGVMRPDTLWALFGEEHSFYVSGGQYIVGSSRLPRVPSVIKVGFDSFSELSYP